MTPFATLPHLPYYAVIFSSQLDRSNSGYNEMAGRMVELASEQEGYLGIESARSEDGFGITVSYWRDEASIVQWKKNAEHRLAQEYGHSSWYEHFELRIARVERAYNKVNSEHKYHHVHMLPLLRT
jgi:heme-degrading monooxygenase HmoA